MSTGVKPLTPQQAAKNETQVTKAGYIHRVLIGLDQFMNTILGGQDDETMSARAARDAEQHKVVGEVVSKGLDVIQPNHGSQAVAGDLERAKEVTTLEDKSGLLPSDTQNP